jgi:glycosyltransferase involved in cell wall biosynthesis
MSNAIEWTDLDLRDHTRPDVSVVIPTHNRCESLVAAIESVLHQTTSVPYEVIVVDNKSTDETPRVVERYAASANGRVRYVFEAGPGISRGRNAGIRASRAELVAFIDDDCRAGPGWISTIKKTFDDHPEVGCIGGKVLPHWKQQPPGWLDKRHWGPLAITDYGDLPLPMNAFRPVCLVCASLAVRREVFENVGLFSPEFSRSEDHELELRFYNAGGQALYVPTLVATTEVPLNRCTKGYHRRWHAQHGRDCAALHLNERIGARGELLATEVASVALFTVPLYLYRELLRAAFAWTTAFLHASRSVAFEEETRVIYLSSYIRHRYQCWRTTHKASHLAEALSTARWFLTRKFRVPTITSPVVSAKVQTNISGGEER